MIAGIRVAALNSLNKALVLFANAASTISIRMPTVRVATSGVLNVGLTFRIARQPGNRSSRAMAQVRRLAVMKMTKPQAKMENRTNARNTFPTTEPSACVTRSATGVPDFDRALRVELAALDAIMKTITS